MSIISSWSDIRGNQLEGMYIYLIGNKEYYNHDSTIVATRGLVHLCFSGGLKMTTVDKYPHPFD